MIRSSPLLGLVVRRDKEPIAPDPAMEWAVVRILWERRRREPSETRR